MTEQYQALQVDVRFLRRSRRRSRRAGLTGVLGGLRQDPGALAQGLGLVQELHQLAAEVVLPVGGALAASALSALLVPIPTAPSPLKG